MFPFYDLIYRKVDEWSTDWGFYPSQRNMYVSRIVPNHFHTTHSAIPTEFPNLMF